MDNLKYFWYRYIKPKSVSWWASLVPLLAGIVLAIGEAFPEVMVLSRAVIFINAISGGITPFVMVNIGVAGIGFRGAVGTLGGAK